MNKLEIELTQIKIMSLADKIYFNKSNKKMVKQLSLEIHDLARDILKCQK